MDNVRRKLIAAVLLTAFIGVSHTQVEPRGHRAWKWCFVCSGKSPDRECESYPQYVANGRINCTRRYCTTTVKYDVKRNSLSFDDKGISETARPLTPKDLEVISIARNCEDLPRGNRCVRDNDRGATFTCYSTCLQDYCNAETRAPTWSDLNISRLRTLPFNDSRSANRGEGTPKEGPDIPPGNPHPNRLAPNGFDFVTPPAYMREFRRGFPGYDSRFGPRHLSRTETVGVRPPNAPIVGTNHFRPSFPQAIDNGRRRPLPELNRPPPPPPSVGGASRPYSAPVGGGFRPPEQPNDFRPRMRPNYVNGAGQPTPDRQRPTAGHRHPSGTDRIGFPADRMPSNRLPDPMQPSGRYVPNVAIAVRRPEAGPDQFTRLRNADWPTRDGHPDPRNGLDGGHYRVNSYEAPKEAEDRHFTSVRPGDDVNSDNEIDDNDHVDDAALEENTEGKDKDEPDKRSRLPKEYGKKSRMDNKRGEPLFSKEMPKSSDAERSSSNAVTFSFDIFFSVFLMPAITSMLNY